MASRVGPAVTNTFFPFRGNGSLKRSRIPFMMTPMSGSRPSPSCRLASWPSSGSNTILLLSRRFSTASIVAGFCHIRLFIAGANKVGCSHTERVVDTTSSATPLAALQIILAVAGITTMASNSIAISICSSPTFGVSGNISVMTSWLVRAAKVVFPINSCADFVIMTCTLAPSLRSRRTTSQAL